MKGDNERLCAMKRRIYFYWILARADDVWVGGVRKGFESGDARSKDIHANSSLWYGQSNSKMEKSTRNSNSYLITLIKTVFPKWIYTLRK